MSLLSSFPLFPAALLAVSLAAPAAAPAQEWHAVGTGTATNGPNGVPCPFGDIYAGQRAQYLYLASELSAAGLSAGDAIARIRWVVTALNGSGMHENYTLRIGATAATSLSGFLATPTGASTTPADHQPVLGNNDFTLDHPFTWNGTSNLLVEVTHFSPTYGTATANASVAFTSTAPVKRSYSLLDDLMYATAQTDPLDPDQGETLNSTGLPNIVLGVATACPPPGTTGYTACLGATVPAGEGVAAEGCAESLGGRFTASYTFPGTDLECTGTDYVQRSSITLPELPAGAVVQAGRLILTGVQAPDPVYMSDLYLRLSGSIDGEIQLMPNHEGYSGTVPELIVAMSGPYEAGVAELSTASTYGTGYIGSVRAEFDYLLPTPFWYDAPTGGNLVAYGQGTLDPVAAGLASTDAPGTTTLYVDCGVSGTACLSTRAPVDFTVLSLPEPSFTMSPATVVQGVDASFTYTGTAADSYAWDFGDGATSTDMNPEHAWGATGTYTVALTVANGPCEATYSTDVVVDINSGIAAATAPGAVRVFAGAGMLHIEHVFGASPVHVEVIDALGRTAVDRDRITSPGRIDIATSMLNAGVWFVRVTSGDVQRTFRVPLTR